MGIDIKKTGRKKAFGSGWLHSSALEGYFGSHRPVFQSATIETDFIASKK